MPRQHQKHGSRHFESNQKPIHGLGSESQLAESVRSDPSIVHLDGRTLEGGGQLVRVALTLSALTSIPVHIHNIRGKRSGKRSGHGGGLKASHLAALEFLASAVAARTQGAHVGSTEALFEPLKNKQIAKSRANDPQREMEGGEMYEIRLEKPGSVWLVLQAILPYIVFAASGLVPKQLIITGGTNVPKSMSGEYVKQVMCCMFKKMGLPSLDVDIRKRGWTHGRAIQLAEVGIKVHPLEKGEKLPAFELKERGDVTKIAISVLAGTDAMRAALVEHAKRSLDKEYPQLPQAEVVVNEDSCDAKRLYVLLVAHTSNGYRLGRDWLYDEKIKGTPNESQTELIAKRMAQKVVEELDAELSHGGCVDEYMRDQLVVFEAVAAGRSLVYGGVDGGEGSLHTQTCRWVAEQILANQVSFDAGGGCTGAGFSAGEICAGRAAMDRTIVSKDEKDGQEGQEEPDIMEDTEGRDQPVDGELAWELEGVQIVQR